MFIEFDSVVSCLGVSEKHLREVKFKRAYSRGPPKSILEILFRGL
jgi:hypothetical protein